MSPKFVCKLTFILQIVVFQRPILVTQHCLVEPDLHSDLPFHHMDKKKLLQPTKRPRLEATTSK